MKFNDLIEVERHTAHDYMTGRKTPFYLAQFNGTGLVGRGDTRQEAVDALLADVRERLNFEGPSVYPTDDNSVIVVTGPSAYQFFRRDAPLAPFRPSSCTLIDNARDAARLHAAQLRCDTPRLGFECLADTDVAETWVKHTDYVLEYRAHSPNKDRAAISDQIREDRKSFRWMVGDERYSLQQTSRALEAHRRGDGALIALMPGGEIVYVRDAR